MNSDQLAQFIAASIARHQTRGLVDDATGMTDVVIHGRVDLLAVADDVLGAAVGQLKPARRSWAAWFSSDADARRDARRQARKRAELAEKLESGLSATEAAIARLRLRDEY